MVDKTLANIREKARESASFLGMTLIVSILLIIAGIAADLILPIENALWANLIRCVIALTLAPFLFSFGYSIAVRQHDGNVRKAERTGSDYVDYRLRYSSSMRLRQSAVVAAVLALVAIVTSYSPIYTDAAASVIAGFFALVAYCRLTPDEKVLRDYGVPDPRDVLEEQDAYERELNAEAEKRARDEEVEYRKRRMLGQQDEDDEEDYDEEEPDGYDDESDEQYNDAGSDFLDEK